MSARAWEEEGEPQDRPKGEPRRDRRRREQKVHRRSSPSRWAKNGFSSKFEGGKPALKRLLDAAMFYADRLPREARAAYGEITAKYLRVYRELVLFWVKSVDGLVEPAGAEIAYKARCGEATVWRALEVLERHGFLKRMRRFRPARSGEAGRWEQDKNAYRILTPEPAAQLVDSSHAGLDPKAVPPRKPPRPRPPRPSLACQAINIVLELWGSSAAPKIVADALDVIEAYEAAETIKVMKTT